MYEDEDCKTAAKTKSGDPAVITIKEDGSSDEIEVQTGDYYIKETVAPRGYALDEAVHSITVKKGQTTTYTAEDVPKNNPVNIIVSKVDKETGLSRPQGSASLEGAEFTIKYYDVYPDAEWKDEELLAAIKDRKPASINGNEAVWVMKTDESGAIDFSQPDKHVVSEKSGPLYVDSSGHYTLPIGIVTIQETAAPKGYLLDRTVFVRAITELGTKESVDSFQALVDTDAVAEQVFRSDITFSKSAEGKERLHNIPFRITSKTTGESHIIITDDNGYANTAASWNAHTCNTNGGITAMDGIWFNGYNDETTGAKPDNTLAALPYDEYTIEELPCDSNKGYKLISDTISITRNAQVIDMGTYDDEELPAEEPDEPTSDEPDDPKPSEPASNEPDEPEADEPDEPSTPDKPEKTVTHQEKTIKTSRPETGDENIMLLIYAAVAALAAVEVIVLTVKRKGDRLKTNNEDVCAAAHGK